MEAFERFDFDLNNIARQIKKNKAKIILLQFPEGLKMKASDVVMELEQKTGAKFIVSGEPSWGACDIDASEAKSTGADLIVNFGHAPFFKPKFPVVYAYIKDNKDFTELLVKSLSILKSYKTISLVSAIQHIHKLEEVKEFYEKAGKEVKIPKALGHAHIDGHVVGCEYSGLKLIKKQLEAVVVLGNRFHALGAALALPKIPVILIDTYNNSVSSMNELRDKVIKQRAIAISKFKQARKIAIITGLKEGQKFGTYEIIKKKFEKQGKEVMILSMREITPEKIFNFYNTEAFVELACPRIASDDYARYNKPIITFKEALVVLQVSSWESLLENGFL